VFTKRVHVFKAGPQVSAQGVQREFTPEDLQEAAESYDPSVHEAPLVIGHSGDNDGVPSYGWIKKLVRSGEDLYADVDFTDAAKDLVKNGHYKKLSISFYAPNSPINPHEGKWSVRHLALLGASPPAVKGLEPFSFSEKDGVFDFATSFSPKEVFDDELGPTLLVERSPLELLKERLDTFRGEMGEAAKELEESQEEQTETNVEEQETTNSADEMTAPNNPNQQFSEMKKKMGREGAEVSESAQDLEDLENMPSKEDFEEGVSRKKSKGAHGQNVQVVQEVFEEAEEEEKEFGELPPALKANAAKMKAKAKMKKMEEEGEEEMEFEEVSHKSSKEGKVSFGSHSGRGDDPAGRGKTASSDSDGHASRMKVGKGEPEEREDEGEDEGDQDEDRGSTAKDSLQDISREKLAKADPEEGDGESRWADQPEGKKRALNGDQYSIGEDGLPERGQPEVSDGTDPYGRDGGPTQMPIISEEEPDVEEIAVPLKSTKGNKVSRVLHTESGQKRAETLGGDIADHSEESDGVTRTPKKAAVSNGTDARGRAGGPTEFPTKSEEEPDDMEMAVDLMSVEDSPSVRVMRQKSGDKASTNYKEASNPMTKTGKGSTYGQKTPAFEMEDEEDFEDEEDDFSETEDFCGMGSMGQAPALGYPIQMFEEFQKQLQELKSENSRLKKDHQEQQTRHRKQKIAEFVDSLYTEGKLTDGIIPQRELQSYCEGLEFGTLQFSEGESPTTTLFGILERLPNLVYFGEVVAEGRFKESPEEEDLDPHTRALKMVENGECSDYVEAIKRCIPWGEGA
jgi:hypothetical protein